MCRFAVYSGPPLRLSHLLSSPNHSLLKQSYACRERRTPTNEDGYGIGWYNQAPYPNLLLGERPAHQDPVFETAAGRIRSYCFFGHVRAASQGMHVRIENCHPFRSDSLLWMHNGLISGFEKIGPLITEQTRHLAYRMRGSTDSEASFALFLRHFEETLESGWQRLVTAMRRTVLQLEAWRETCGIADTHYLNLAVSDGRSIVVTRYYTPGHFPLTLYYWQGDASDIAAWAASEDFEPGAAVVVASEPVQDSSPGWNAVPMNHLVVAGPDLFQVLPIQP